MQGNKLIGKNFTRLLVLENDGKDKHGNLLWSCKCDCGTIKTIPGYSLVSNKVLSCGCLGRERRSLANTKNCKGETFGRLFVLRDAGRDRHGKALWECLCACGNKTIATTSSLTSGHTKSCGCLSSENIIKYNKSEKHRIKVSEHNKNKKWSMESRKKSSMTKLKQSENEWVGFTTPLHKRIYNWLKYVVGWHDDVKERDFYTCQECGDDKGGNLNSHHVISLKTIMTANNIKSIEDAKKCKILYDLNNGKTLCGKCHISVHKKLRGGQECALAS